MRGELAVGETVSGAEHSYTIEREIGRGGFGVTFFARRSGDDLGVALKSLHISRLKDWKGYELFERETSVLRRLDHPNIPDYVDDFGLGEDPKAPEGLVLVQEYIDGYPLSDVVQGKRSLDEGQMVAWFAQILEVLDYLHTISPPVIHRDITPKNILIREQDQAAFLVDFGTVQAAIRSASEVASTSAGTFGYAPMEQFVSAAFPASDLYGLGMTCLAVASGCEPSEMPFNGLRVDVRKLTSFDARLTLLLQRMTEPDPERRLGDARIALEQLRPLLSRYASDRGVAAAAIQKVAESNRSKGGARTRTTVSSDDLLPSERIREAAVRLGQLGLRVLSLPALEKRLERVESAAINETGSVIGVNHDLIDVASMTHVHSIQRNMNIIAIDATAEIVVACPESAWSREEMVLFHRDGKGYRKGAKISVDSSEAAPSISPDGSSLALVAQGDLHLFDAKTGGLIQRMKGSYSTARYSPDGGAIICYDDNHERVRLLHSDGREESLRKCTELVFAPDGQTVARFSDGKVEIGPLEGDKRSVSLGRDMRSVKHPRFSPDGRWLAFNDYSPDLVVVVDVERGEVAHKLASPTHPKEKIRCVNAIGFSADGSRLIVACDVHYSRFLHDDSDCVAIWALPSGTYLGAVLREDDSNATMLAARSGFFGRVGSENVEARRTDDPWYRPEVARRALCGEPVDELLDETARAQLADLEARWAFFHDHHASKTIEPDARVPQLVEHARGLTHLLDAIIRRARDAQSRMPTFGGGNRSTALTGDQIRTAANELRALGDDERNLLFEELVAEAEGAEETTAGGKREAPMPAPPIASAAGSDDPPPVQAMTVAPPQAVESSAARTALYLTAGGIAVVAGIVAALLSLV